VGHAVSAGERSLLALAVVVAVAVLREGAEVVLFLYGIAASSQAGAAALMLGGALGVAAGGLVSYLLYRGLVAIPVSRLFSVTSWLIALLAGADLIPAWGYQLWDTSWLLPQNSLPGQALHALVGYSDRPLGVQVVAYLVVLAALVAASRLVNSQSPKDGRRATQNVSHGHRSS